MIARLVTIAVIIGIVVVSPSVAFSLETRSQPKPNIVFILADDLGWGELGCYGQQKIPTPHIDNMAARGMRFTQHYSGAPVCAPSRCVLMTGKHLGHAEIRGNRQAKVSFPQFTEGQHPLSRESLTFVQVLKQAGYATGGFGKWGLGPVGSTGAPNRKGFDLFFGYNCQAVAHSYYPSHLWRNEEKLLINDRAIPGHAKQPEGLVVADEFIGRRYAPELMIAEAEQFIEDNRERPFFLYVPLIEPHVAMHPPVQSVNRFPEQWDDMPYRGECGYLPHPRPRAAYAAMISDMDQRVGRVLKALDTAGVADHTLVVFSSDNGATHEGPSGTAFHIGGADPKFFNSTAGLRGYKGSVYEGGIRVPMIACWPGHIPAGVTNGTASYFADWFPTLCDVIGLPQTPDLDGESLWRTLRTGESHDRHRPMVWVFPEYGGQVAVRIEDYKVVRRNLSKQNKGDWEVYDLASDPGERVDISHIQQSLIDRARTVLQQETSINEIFPVVF